MTITFEVDGAPVPQSRPRFTRQGHAYEAEKSRKYKELVRAAAVEKMKGREPWNGAVSAYLTFYLPMPKSWSKKKRGEALRGLIVPTGRVGDTDNYLKTVLDACNGVIYADDSQVYNVTATKWYGEEPGMVAEFRCL